MLTNRATPLRTIKVTESGTIRQCWCSFLLVFYSNFVPKMHHFWDIRLQTLAWWGQGSWRTIFPFFRYNHLG